MARGQGRFATAPAGSSGTCSQFTLRPKKRPPRLYRGYVLPLLTI